MPVLRPSFYGANSQWRDLQAAVAEGAQLLRLKPHQNANAQGVLPGFAGDNDKGSAAQPAGFRSMAAQT